MSRREKYKSEDEWLEARRSGIGGSDVPAIFGTYDHNYKDSTPYAVWCSKMGIEFEISPEKQEIFDRGHWFEPPLLEYFAEQTNLKTRHCDREIIIHDDNPVWRCSLDGEVHDEKTGFGIVEAKSTIHKTTNVFSEWYCQLQYQLGVTGADWGAAVWIDGAFKRQIAFFQPDKPYIKKLLTETLEWWNKYVVAKTEPPALTAWDVMKMYPYHKSGVWVDATAEWLEKHARYIELSDKRAEIIAEMDSIKEDGILLIGEAEGMKVSSRELFTLKTNKNGSRVFRKIDRRN